MQNKVVCIVRGGGKKEFEAVFAKDNTFYKPGMAESVWYRHRKAMGECGYELISLEEGQLCKSEVCAMVHHAIVYPELVKNYPDIIHIHYAVEPPAFGWDSKREQRRLSRMMDYSITEHEDAVDEEIGIFKLPYSYDFDIAFDAPPFYDRTLLLATVTQNKWNMHPHQLYDERRRVIDWFEHHAADEFAFYGTSWDAGHMRYKTYRGVSSCKLTDLSQARFALCLENQRDVAGYITEKMFDAMIAGCIPVYWGASNMADYKLDGCFVDYSKLRSPKKLYQYLQSLGKEQMDHYLQNIQNWLQSDQTAVFASARFAKVVAECIQRGKRTTPTTVDYLWMDANKRRIAVEFFLARFKGKLFNEWYALTVR